MTLSLLQIEEYVQRLPLLADADDMLCQAIEDLLWGNITHEDQQAANIAGVRLGHA